MPTTSPSIPASTRDRWIQTLRSPSPNTPAAYHRDGLLFQLISWIAAFKTYSADALVRAPHTIMAHKGADNLILCPSNPAIGCSTGAADLRIVVCEDKATEHPRDTVRDEVWPSLRSFEQGAHDHELLPDVTMMLSGIAADLLDGAIDAVFAQPKWYRVSLALDADPTPALFAGFDIEVPGPERDRRRGEYLRTPRALREWMVGLSTAIADHLEQLPPA